MYSRLTISWYFSGGIDLLNWKLKRSEIWGHLKACNCGSCHRPVSTKVFIGNIALATANNFRVVLGRDHSSPNCVGEVRSRTLHHTKAWFVTGSFLYPPAFFSIWFLDFFPTWKSKLKNPNHPEVNRRRITSQHFHRVIIVSHSFKCQKLKLFLTDGGKPWPMAEAGALLKLRVKK